MGSTRNTPHEKHSKNDDYNLRPKRKQMTQNALSVIRWQSSANRKTATKPAPQHSAPLELTDAEAKDDKDEDDMDKEDKDKDDKDKH
eukprot:4568469-Amphidinium_carterae.1